MTFNFVSLPTHTTTAARRSRKRLRTPHSFRVPYFEFLERRELLFAGDLDLAFGSTGKVVTEFNESTAWSHTAYSSVIQANGKILAAGEGALSRYNSDGSLDLSFGKGGKAPFPYFARSITLQSDGKIVVSGSVTSAGVDFAVTRYHPTGTLDTSFDSDGKVTIDLGSTTDQAYGVAIQSDGKILVVGSSGDYFAAIRLNANGKLDSGFNGNGKLARKFHSRDAVHSVALQADGKIVLAGQSLVSTPGSSNYDFLVVRLLPNGAQDNTFDGDGWTTTGFSPMDRANSVAIQANGKIVVVGSAQEFSTSTFAVARYNTSGKLDTTFDGDGVRTDTFPYVNTRANDVAVQPDGRILVAGHSSNLTAMVRYNNTGGLDASFGSAGKLLSSGGQVQSISLQSDGKLVAVGNSNGTFSVSRYTAKGSTDPTFSTDGRVFTNFGPSFDNATAMVLQNDSKIVVAGQSDGSFALARYNSNGSLDTSFSGDGKLTLDFGIDALQSKATSIALQSDGKLVVAGTVQYLVGDFVYSDFAVARLNADGSLDLSFSGDGKLTTDFGDFDQAFAVAVQPNGKVLVGGGTNEGFGIARYNANGSADTSFDVDGQLTTFFDGVSAQISSLALQPDGKILAAGSVGMWDVSEHFNVLAIARYNLNGSLDFTFDGDGLLVDSGNAQRFASDIVIQPNGRIVVSGATEQLSEFQGFYTDFAVSRYLASGVRDTSFDVDGTRVLPFGTPSLANSIALFPDGRILAAGKAGGDFALASLNADGTLDSRFAGDGKLVTDFGVGDFVANSVAIQSDGKIVAAGSGQTTFQNSPDSDFAVVRYRNDPTPTFATTVSVTAAGGVVVSDQWNRDDALELRRSSDRLIITDKTEDSNARINVTGIAGTTGSGTKQVSIPLAKIEERSQPLVINPLGGNDRIELNTDRASGDVIPVSGLTLSLGTGTDSVLLTHNTTSNTWNIAGPQSGTIVMGSLGSIAFSGLERAFGGESIDTFKIHNTGINGMTRLHGGAGTQDTVQITRDADFRLFQDLLPFGDSRLMIDAVVDQTFDFSSIEKVFLTGGPANNRIDAFDFRGTVVLNGGPGDDQLYGGTGNDQLFGEIGNDLLVGGNGDDMLHGGSGDDILIGEDGSDTLYGDEGFDLIVGGQVSYLYYYGSQSARDAILAAWFAAEPYARRVSILSTQGVGPNDEYKLTPNYGVFDDFDVDTLFGGSGEDWYFAKGSGVGNEVGLVSGGLRDQVVGEYLTEL